MIDNYETKRTIEEVLDLETGLIINSKEFFEQSEDVIVRYRRRLEESIQRYDNPKFVCPYCKQLLKLSGKSTQRGQVSFFAHQHDSDECEIKTDNKLTKEEIEAIKYGNVRESERHIKLKGLIYNALTTTRSKELGIENVAKEKRVISKIPNLNWRQPDISADYNGKKIVFELQLSTTFLSVIVERDVFYKMNEIFIIWVFNFSDNKEFVNMGNLMCKDIYYSNKRNAFVFDEKAKKLSLERNELILNCILFEPFVKNGIFYPAKSIKRSEYISLNDLKFDELNYKPFYIDADKLFEKYQPNLYQQREIDEKTLLERIKKSVYSTNKKLEQVQIQNKNILTIKAKLQSKEIVLKPFLKGEKWGYEANGTVIVTPTFTEATEFGNNEFARVKKNRRYGFINLDGQLVIECNYVETFDISNSKCIVKYDKEWFCIDLKTKKSEPLKVKNTTKFSNNYLVTESVTVSKIISGTFRSFTNYRNDYISTFKLLNLDGTTIIDDCSKIINIKNQAIIIKKNSEYKIITPELKELFPYSFEYIQINTEEKSISNLIAKRDGLFGYISTNGNIIIPFIYQKIDEFIDNSSIAKLNNKRGIIDTNGKVLLKFEYDYIGYFKEGFASIEKDNKWGIVCSTGKIVIQTEYDYQLDSYFYNLNVDIIPARKNGTWGKINRSGIALIENSKEVKPGIFIGEKFGKYGVESKKKEIILPFDYDKIEYFFNDIVKAKQSKLWGCINFEGIIVIPFEYDSIEEFIDGRAKAKQKSKWGYIDINGNTIIPFEYDSIEEFTNGRAKAMKNSCFGYIDMNGKTLIPFEYKSIEEFTNGRAKAMKNFCFGYIDMNGKTLIPFEYKSIDKFVNGRAKARKESHFGYIDMNGKILIPFEYDSIEIFEDGRSRAKKDSKWGYIDSNGYELIEDTLEIENGYLKGKIFEKWGIMSKINEIIIPFEYDYIDKFVNGNAIAKKSGNWGSIDITGKSIIPFVYSSIEEFIDGKAKVRTNGKIGYIDVLGNELIEDIMEIENGYLMGKKFEKWGIISNTNDIIIPFEYDSIKDFQDTKLKAKKNGNWGYIDINGNIIIPFEYDDFLGNYNGGILALKNGMLVKIPIDVQANKLNLEITGIADFGLFLKIGYSFNGLLHISEIKRVGKSIDDYSEGEFVEVYISTIDTERKKVSLSFISTSNHKKSEDKRFDINSLQIGERCDGTITSIAPFGLFVKIKGEITALVHITEIIKNRKNISLYNAYDLISVSVLSIDKEKNRIMLTL